MIPIHIMHQHTSEEARALAAQLTSAIDAYRLSHPKCTQQDVQTALTLIQPPAATQPVMVRLMIVASALTLVAGTAAALRPRNGEPFPTVLVSLGLGLGLFFAFVAFAVRSRLNNDD